MKRILEGLFMVGMIAVMAGVLIVPAMAATSDGSFTISSSPPEVGQITLYQADGIEEVGDGTMTPQTYYQLGMVVSDANSLEDLTEIKVVINDTGYTDPANNVSQQATYIWTPSGGWLEDGSPTGTNTWEIVSGDCTVPDPLTALSGTWKVKFMPGKVAKETAWMATVTATSGGGSDTGDLTALSMEWYGELATDDTGFDFDTVGLDAGPVAIVTPDDNKVDFTAITNGDYKLQSNTTNWAHADPAATVTLEWDGELESGDFGLKNYGSNSTASANFVQPTPVTITGEDNEVSNYSEDGNAEPVYMWLYTASEGIMTYTYSGTYTMELSNNA